ncbi:MAG: iron-sulfur cluster repair protein YtfE [Hydrogenophaga sp.]|uniref:iron-sulfur cluster repair protein YtfE n=3 Tax=Hydrogenophaga sp. TaxID=1904254 RepID=UPI0025C54C4D|nr:iron-sulfur cluster repair protein YtfE [Hydrogenophaga sp.]MBT9554241.1 iron-sulfur cluster repair protein YtfE [Hydrogenophaga sp.]
MNHAPTVAIPTADRAQQAIGQIAVDLPGSTAVFRRLKLDFCCGGQVPLQQACNSKGLPLDAVLAELASLERSSETPVTESPEVMIDHILARYHAVHREQLPELIRMARRVEAVHRDSPDVPHGLAEHLEIMEAELLDHMDKEEQVLFPMLQAGGHPQAADPIHVLREEHTGHGQMLERLMALTGDATPPQGACNTWRALYAGIAQLSDDLINHIHLENNLLFPRFEPSAETQAVAA